MRRYYRSKEKRRKRKLQAFLQAQARSPLPSPFCDSLLGTPRRSCVGDFEGLLSTETRAQKANRIWELNNSTTRRESSRRKLRSETVNKREDSKVRFKSHSRGDSSSEVSPCKLDFSEKAFDSSLYKRSSKRSPRKYHESFNSSRRSRGKEEKDSCLKKVYPTRKRTKTAYQNGNSHQTQIKDFRDTDDKENSGVPLQWRERGTDKKLDAIRPCVIKNSFGDYDLFDEYSFN